MDASVLAFLKFMVGSVLTFLKYTDSCVWTHLNVTYVWYDPALGFPFNVLTLDFHSKGILVYHSYNAKQAENFLFEI